MWEERTVEEKGDLRIWSNCGSQWRKSISCLSIEMRWWAEISVHKCSTSEQPHLCVVKEPGVKACVVSTKVYPFYSPSSSLIPPRVTTQGLSYNTTALCWIWGCPWTPEAVSQEERCTPKKSCKRLTACPRSPAGYWLPAAHFCPLSWPVCGSVLLSGGNAHSLLAVFLRGWFSLSFTSSLACVSWLSHTAGRAQWKGLRGLGHSC